MFDNFNENLRKSKGFLTSTPCIPSYSGIQSIEHTLSNYGIVNCFLSNLIKDPLPATPHDEWVGFTPGFGSCMVIQTVLHNAVTQQYIANCHKSNKLYVFYNHGFMIGCLPLINHRTLNTSSTLVTVRVVI